MEVANIGRTVLNVVICSVVSTVVVVIGLLIGSSAIALLTDSLPVGSLLVGGVQMTGEMAVIYAPFQVIFFFAQTFGMYRAARLFGSDQSFYDHVHIFSIAYAPTLILLSFMVMLLMLLSVLMIGQINPNVDYWTDEELAARERFVSLFPVFLIALLIGFLYTLAVWGHSLGTVHRQGIALGIVAAIIGLVVSVLVTIPATCCILSNLMSLGNPGF